MSFSGSQAYQKAFESRKTGHSLFTYYLLEGLSGNKQAVDNNGCVTPDLLGKFIYDKIMSLPPEQDVYRGRSERSNSPEILCFSLSPTPRAKKDTHNQAISIKDLRLVIGKCKRYHAKGEFKKELDYLREATNKYPNSFDLWNTKGMALEG